MYNIQCFHSYNSLMRADSTIALIRKINATGALSLCNLFVHFLMFSPSPSSNPGKWCRSFRTETSTRYSRRIVAGVPKISMTTRTWYSRRWCTAPSRRKALILGRWITLSPHKFHDNWQVNAVTVFRAYIHREKMFILATIQSDREMIVVNYGQRNYSFIKLYYNVLEW